MFLSWGIVAAIIVLFAVLIIWSALVLSKRLLSPPVSGVSAPMMASVIAIQQIC